MFEWSWYRFTIPEVIAGLVIMILGMIILLSARKLNLVLLKALKKPIETAKSYTIIIKIIAGIIVFIGAFLILFSL